MNIITCKHCGKDIELSEALMHQVEEKVKKEVTKDVAQEIEKARLEEGEKVKKELELQNKEEVEKLKQQNAEFRVQELKLREEKQKLEEAKKQMEVENARTLDEERKKIEEKTHRDFEEAQRLKDKEKEMQIENLKRMLEEANRKASGVSQQVQGEVLEVDLEEALSRNFPNDEVAGIAKGVKGGDIFQTVRNSFGKTAGAILWETKRAKWSPSWLPKLREDTRKVGATYAILVSEELPKEMDKFGLIDGVLVTTYIYALPLAYILRRDMMLIAQAKSTAANKDEKVEKLYTYLQSDTFRHRFEAYVEGIVEMQRDLETEKRSAQRLWKKREFQITRTLDNISNMYGELQGIMGSSLPDIKMLSLESGEDEVPVN